MNLMQLIHKPAEVLMDQIYLESLKCFMSIDEFILMAFGENISSTNTTHAEDKNSFWESLERDNNEVVFCVFQKFHHW